MSFLRNRLLKFDFFGSQFQFSVMGNNKYKSLQGLFMSSCCLIMVIIVTIMFGKDFYNKENPRIVSESIKTTDYKEFNLTPNNITIAFRLEDHKANVAKFSRELIKTKVRYARFIYNDTSQEFDELSYYLKSVQCDESLVPDPKFNKERNLTEWECLDLPKEGLLFGGSWNSKANYHFNIEYSTCDNNGNNCSNINDVRSLLLSDFYYFSMFYPDYYFLPNDINSPQNIKYFNLYTTMVPSLHKTYNLYFKSYLLDDDLGWIFKNIKSTPVIAFDSVDKDFEINDFSSNQKNYKFFSLYIYYNSDYEKISRSYMKIQELSALVGGFMKIIIFIAEIIIVPYNKFLMRLSLVNQFYDCSQKKEERKLISLKVKMKMNDSNSVQMVNEDKIKEKKENEIHLNNNKVNNVGLQKNNTNNAIPNKKEPSSRKKSDLKIQYYISPELSLYYKEILKKALILRNKTKFNISYLQYLINLMFNSTKKINIKEFLIADDLLNQKMDVVTFLEVSKQFEIMKQLNLTYYQNLSLPYIRNPDVNNSDDVALSNLILFNNKNKLFSKDENSLATNKFNEMIHYFKLNKSNDNLSEKDLRIIDCLPLPIKQFINE